jgi:hypothetical protein
MSFESGRRRGKTWADVKLLDDLIKKTKFNLTTKSERECELSFANILLGMEEKFNGKIYSQIDQDTSVKAVFCFGKKHRPDLTIDEDGIAIEIKFIKDSLDGIKNALGQSLMYRLRYKFVINVIIVSEKNKDTYYKADNEEDKDLFDILKYLSEDMNIFTYIVPSFSLNTGVKRVLESNDINDE